MAIAKAKKQTKKSAGKARPQAARDVTPPSGAIDPRLAKIARAFENEPGVTFGKLFASYGLRVRGKIFAMIVRGNLVVKLPKARVDELVSRGAGTHFEPGPGRVMKEWISMSAPHPDPIALAREAHAFVAKKT